MSALRNTQSPENFGALGIIRPSRAGIPYAPRYRTLPRVRQGIVLSGQRVRRVQDHDKHVARLCMSIASERKPSRQSGTYLALLTSWMKQ